MDLKTAVRKYLEAAGEFSRPMPLARFDLPREQIQKTLSAWEEDYHLHRHFELIPASYLNTGDPSFTINGMEYSKIVFLPSIRDVLQE